MTMTHTTETKTRGGEKTLRVQVANSVRFSTLKLKARLSALSARKSVDAVTEADDGAPRGGMVASVTIESFLQMPPADDDDDDVAADSRSQAATPAPESDWDSATAVDSDSDSDGGDEHEKEDLRDAYDGCAFLDDFMTPEATQLVRNMDYLSVHRRRLAKAQRLEAGKA
jgi:hypothetical protein